MNRYLIKEGQESLYSILRNNSSDEPCYNFYKYTGEEEEVTTLTRKELLEKSMAVGKLLRENNIQKNDKLIVFTTNTCDNILSMVGTTLCGGTFTQIMPPVDLSKIDRFISVVESLEPKFILTVEPLVSKGRELINKLIDEGRCKELLSKLNIIDVSKAEDSEGFVPEEISLDHIVTIQYTSGSTSAPKGIMTTYGNMVSMANSHSEQSICKSYGGWLPLCHIFGTHMGVMYPVCISGSCSNIMTPADFLENPYRWFKMLSDTKSEITTGPNSIFESYPQMMPASKFKNIDLSSIKKMLSGSEPANNETMKKFTDAYKDLGLAGNVSCTVYGLSEATGGVSMTNKKIIVNGKPKNVSVLDLDSSAYLKGKIVLAEKNAKNTIQYLSNGDLFYGVTVKIVNPNTLKECKEDEIGEVWIDSPGVALGYYNNEEATKESFGWKLEGYPGTFFRTGDLGFMYDEELYVTGRIKELMIVNGKNIVPNDVQLKLKDNVPQVKNFIISVFSIIKNNKEQVVIIIGTHGETDLDYEGIKEDVNSCMLKYFEFTPYSIRFVKESTMPRADGGKILTLKIKRFYSEDKLEFIDSIENKEELDEDCTDIENEIKQLIKEKYSYDVKKDTNILSMGMNSLDVVRLANILENRFNVGVPVKFIFSNPTVVKIGMYIDKSLNGEKISSVEEDKSYLYNEAVLPENIKIKKYDESGLKIRNVFLTGSTGFLGAYLISDLINEKAEKIYCHVRCKNKEEGFARIKSNMEYYKLWNEEYSKCIEAVPGSLDKPLLGIEKKEYEFLCENIDIIYHNGAVLNFIYPYETLRETNVLGTIRTLEMACTGKMKYYNYVSSYSVYDNPSHFGKLVSEDDFFEKCEGYSLCYSETKWVCEKIINIARQKGLKAAIYRPGDITGSIETGIWKYSDMVSRIIKSILQYGVYPNWDRNIYMTSVDYVAEAIVKISMSEESYTKSFNVINKQTLSIKKLADLINECGYNVKEMDYEEWLNKLGESNMNHPLKPLESLFKSTDKNFATRYGSASPIYSTLNVDSTLDGTNVSCQKINIDVMRKYIENFKK